jgi:hypothetical protein
LGLSRGRSLLSVLAVAVILGGCGSSDSGETEAATETTSSTSRNAHSGVDPARYSKRAEGICARGVRETHTLGRRLAEVVSNSATPEAAITNGVVKPGIEILEREGNSLRSLGQPPDSRTWQVFVGLYDPIVELARQRLQATAAGEPERARGIEQMIGRLEGERSAAARQLGLDSCGVQFSRALGGSG